MWQIIKIIVFVKSITIVELLLIESSQLAEPVLLDMEMEQALVPYSKLLTVLQ